MVEEKPSTKVFLVSSVLRERLSAIESLAAAQIARKYVCLVSTKHLLQQGGGKRENEILTTRLDCEFTKTLCAS
jgi:hypothetical protein